MAEYVTMGATLKCSFGTMTCSLIVTDPTRPTATNKYIATMMDYTLLNIPTFGMCSNPSNPAVAAAMGAPVPCLPVIVAPWSGASSNLKLNYIGVLTKSSKLTCTYAGQISIQNAGQSNVTE